MTCFALTACRRAYMLAEAMTYTRTDTPDFSTRLSRDELRVFTAVQGETAFAAIVTKTRLEPGVAEEAVAKLVARKLLKPVDGDAPQPQVRFVPPAQAASAWLERRRSAEAFLQARVGGDKALPYVAQLQNCGSEQAFADTVRALAKRLSLIVDANIGKELLTFLDG